MNNNRFRISVVLFAALVAALPVLAQDRVPLPHDRSSMGDGFIHLKGTIYEAKTNADVVTFLFSGRLSFSFFTAAYGDLSRTKVDIDFEIKKVPIAVPRFGKADYDAESDPFIVSFRNAAKHVME